MNAWPKPRSPAPGPRRKSGRPRVSGQDLKAQEAAGAALKSVLDKIASLDEPDKTNAERIHAIVTGVAPSLAPKLLYGSPAYANADGKPVLFYQERARFKGRYGNLAFFGPAQLDNGTMWPTSYAITGSHRPTRRSSPIWSARRRAIEVRRRIGVNTRPPRRLGRMGPGPGCCSAASGRGRPETEETRASERDGREGRDGETLFDQYTRWMYRSGRPNWMAGRLGRRRVPGVDAGRAGQSRPRRPSAPGASPGRLPRGVRGAGAQHSGLPDQLTGLQPYSHGSRRPAASGPRRRSRAAPLAASAADRRNMAMARRCCGRDLSDERSDRAVVRGQPGRRLLGRLC